jgi:hypothetical protein
MSLTREEHKIRRVVLHRLSLLFATGFWECLDCQAINSWAEGEQGQPNHCATCKSVRLRYHAPKGN